MIVPVTPYILITNTNMALTYHIIGLSSYIAPNVSDYNVGNHALDTDDAQAYDLLFLSNDNGSPNYHVSPSMQNITQYVLQSYDIT